MSTFASLFTGGGGADYSARQLGYSHLWGVEYDAKIASVAALNGFHPMVADVRAVDFSALATPDWLHMSPPCTNASAAKTDAGETALDMELAQACIRAIEILQPRRISLENVWGYRSFASFRAILAALASAGYAVDYWHLNAADYGVPQTRKRLCLVASLDHTPRRPPASHSERQPHADQMSMLNCLPPWRGWYAAIEDLIPSLPDSKFAPWQLRRLPEELKTILLGSENAGQERGKGYREADEPSMALSTRQQSRAFIVHPTNMQAMTIRDRDEPIFTITADGMSSRRPRAFIIPGGNSSNDTIRREHDPMVALSGPKSTNTTRAFIVPGGNMRAPIRDGHDPVFTLPSTRSTGNARAYVGRVVKMTPRALARFNGLGDDYLLPASSTLACKALGNMHILQKYMMEANP